MTLQQFKDSVATSLYDMTTAEAKAKGICIQCKQEARQGINIFTPAGMKEWHISGLCETCFDSICGGLEEEEEEEEDSA